MSATHVQLERAVRPVLAMLQSVTIPSHAGRPSEQGLARPFVTISRQPGAGGSALAHQLVDRLNAAQADGQQWSVWDRELVEQVGRHHHLSAALVDALEERSRSWLEDFFAGIGASATAGEAEELCVYHRVAGTIWALACAGHAVIVGRGGWFITRDLPGGVHVRLIAPLERRIAQMAELRSCSTEAAADWLRRMEAGRNTFYRRYGPDGGPAAECFAITLNAAHADSGTLAECIVPLVRSTERAAVGALVPERHHARAG